MQESTLGRKNSRKKYCETLDKQVGYLPSEIILNKQAIDDFCIISKMDNSYDLLIHERLLIQKDRPILNSQQSSISMVLFFYLAFFTLCLFFLNTTWLFNMIPEGRWATCSEFITTFINTYNPSLKF